jgi:cation:H+ antiporter
MFTTLLLIAVVGSMATGLLYYSCSWLEASSHRLAARYGIPDVVKGSVITAIASSLPELATAVLAIPVHHDFELGLSVIVGSAIYNILVIPSCSVFAQGRSLRSNRELVFREGQFYLVSVTVLLLVVSLAVIYDGAGPLAHDGSEPISGTLTRSLALIPLALYGLYLFIQYEEVKDYRRTGVRDTNVRALREWGIMLGCIGLILFGVEVLLRCAIELGQQLGTPTFLWGLTVVAAATSIPDTLISVRASRKGRSDSSISNVLGSNVFDLLVAVPLGVLLAGAVSVNFTQTVPMMGFLMIATIVMLVFMRRDMEITRAEAVWMMVLYLSFGLWMTAEAFGITSLLGRTAF